MSPDEADRLLRWYPEPWRGRYGEELLAMVEDTMGTEPASRRLRWSLALAGLRERVRRNWLIGPDAEPEHRIRGGSTLVLWAWALLLPAGISFAKLSEHWQVATTSSQRTVPALAVGAAQLLAVIGALVILIATALAAPALTRSLRHGGWRRLRASATITAGLSLAWLSLTVAAVLWAHRLSPAQRNGSSHAYGAMAYGWAALTILTVAFWTGLAVRAERQLPPNQVLLRIEAAAATVVTASIMIVTAAALIWWVSMASTAPWFLQGFIARPGAVPAGVAAHYSSWNWRLVLTAVAMLGATALAVTGMARMARSRHRIAA